MNHHFCHVPRQVLVAALLALLPVAGAQAFNSGSTGADGALNPTVNTEVELPASGILNYTTVNIPAGVTVKFKRNTTNTPVYLLASSDVTIAGTIDVTGQDAKATGTYGDGAQGDDGIPGEAGPGGWAGGRGGRDDAQQRAAIIRGGSGLGPGGGPGGVEGSDGCNAATGYYKYVGMGGAYASNAVKAYGNSCYTPAVPYTVGYGSALLQPLVGGSGGGGGRGGTNYPASGGGGGGGAILIASSGTLRVTGKIDATGGDGGGLSGTGAGGQGAGGSGGAIRLVASTVAGNGALVAAGGCINQNNARRQRCGSSGSSDQFGGSEGRIRVEGESITFTGTSTPAYVRGDVGPVFIANSPSLRISSVAGKAVPAAPTGINDVTLPASTTQAVVVQFESINVPVGNTIKLRLVPAYGATSEVVTPAIAGSTAAGTTQVSVTLPQGPSTLQATTTYTVVVASLGDEALGERLKRLADNQTVETVEVTVALEGGARAKLLTRSGQAFDLPYEALSAIGFRS
ncbi:hypothetical protein XaplCFBP3122_16720 [Xanthomonas arboricola pv. populi]|uniref:PE-PGRS family protein n=1 Tax=Xanthomonas arboricola pv. populi TaxID=487823 RepID=A0A2S6Z1I7_9XANT|nr:hypothetical protein [Xanthomonas arboricola]PPT74435.1 hypothetical protein XaplCFBP3122_16720 [Xanthomonas arboricola pv. populi]